MHAVGGRHSSVHGGPVVALLGVVSFSPDTIHMWECGGGWHGGAAPKSPEDHSLHSHLELAPLYQTAWTFALFGEIGARAALYCGPAFPRVFLRLFHCKAPFEGVQYLGAPGFDEIRSI